MNVIVIHEEDHESGESYVLGVADSVKNAEKIIEEYYGKENFVMTSYQDIRDGSLEDSRTLELKNYEGGFYRVSITLEWFTVNIL